MTNHELALKLANIHHLAIISLNPETLPDIAEKALCRIANESEALADHFIGDDKTLQAKVWGNLINDVEASLEAQS